VHLPSFRDGHSTLNGPVSTSTIEAESTDLIEQTNQIAAAEEHRQWPVGTSGIPSAATRDYDYFEELDLQIAALRQNATG
jgi:hypothetical protein